MPTDEQLTRRIKIAVNDMRIAEAHVAQARQLVRELREQRLGWSVGSFIKLTRRERHSVKQSSRQANEVILRVRSIHFEGTDDRRIYLVQGDRWLKKGEWGQVMSAYGWDWSFLNVEVVDDPSGE